MPTIASMVLKDVLPEYGCPSLTDLARGIGLRKQYAWLLWHGKVALSLEMLRRIHERFQVPVEVLAQVTRATPEKRRGRHPRQGREPMEPEPRPERFGWADGDLDYHPVNPEEEA